jgi:hypothetical protein
MPCKTVAELIEMLEAFSPETEVRFPTCLHDGCNGYAEEFEENDGVLYIRTVYAGEDPS